MAKTTHRTHHRHRHSWRARRPGIADESFTNGALAGQARGEAVVDDRDGGQLNAKSLVSRQGITESTWSFPLRIA
jgi:hypothetical protein